MTAECVRAVRARLGLTQTEFAVRLGMRAPTGFVYVSKIEHGKVLLPAKYGEAFERLARLAGVAPAPRPERPERENQVAPRPFLIQSAPSPPRYVPAPPRREPRPARPRNISMPHRGLDENEICVCGSPRKQHEALKYSCVNCRKGAKGCQFFRSVP